MPTNFKKDEIIVLLGAGASVDAQIPHSQGMIEKIEYLLKNDKQWRKFEKLYYYLKSAIKYSDYVCGNNENDTPNIERLVNTIDEIDKGDKHTLFPFIGAWNPKLVSTAGVNLELLHDFRDKIFVELRDKWLQPSKYQKSASYYNGLVDFKTSNIHPLRVFTLNYDLCIEKVCTTIKVERGFDENQDWNWRRFDPPDEEDPPDMHLSNNCLWLANGVNPTFSYDLTRRCVHVRIDTKTENPENRTGFVHPEFERTVINRRPQIINSVLSIVQNWINRGCPAPTNVKMLGSFEDYCRVIGGIFETAGITGFLDNQDKFREQASPEIKEWKEAFDAWYADNGYKPFTAGQFNQYCEDKDLLMEVRGKGSDKSRTGILASRLGGYHDTINILGGYTVSTTEVKVPNSRSKKNAYRILPVGATLPEDIPPAYDLKMGKLVRTGFGKPKLPKAFKPELNKVKSKVLKKVKGNKQA